MHTYEIKYSLNGDIWYTYDDAESEEEAIEQFNELFVDGNTEDSIELIHCKLCKALV